VQRGGGARQFALAAAELAANTRCQEVVVLDLRGRSPVTEYFVIATGTSPRQMRTVVDEIVDLGKQTGFTAWQQSGYESARWIVLDCVNVVIHVFDGESRDFYDLELLWGDSPRVNWRKELGLPAEYAPPKPQVEEDEELEEVEEQEAETADAGDADMDEDAETELPVVTEVPDESTGSNSVELVETDPPSTRGRKGRDAFPSTVAEEEDTTEEERGMGPMSEAGEAAETLEEDEETVEAATAKARKAGARKGGKGAAKGNAVMKPVKKGVVKAIAKAVAKAVKKAVRKVTKRPVKKVAKKPVKKATKKAAKKRAGKSKR
jgi:ribosome-associated protein